MEKEKIGIASLFPEFIYLEIKEGERTGVWDLNDFEGAEKVATENPRALHRLLTEIKLNSLRKL